jgi:hypothetical protein
MRLFGFDEGFELAVCKLNERTFLRAHEEKGVGGGHLIHVKGARVLGVGADLTRVAVI